MEENGKEVIHINFSAAAVDDVYFPQLNVVGDISNSISRITSGLGLLDKDFSFFDRIRDEVDSHVTKYFEDTRFPYECYAPNTLLLDNALATMGAGLPSAMAAKQLNPEQKVVSVNGDGGFLMNSQELETAVRMGLDLVVIILNDNAYGMIKWKQEGVGFENFGLDFNNPDLVAYANSFGAIGHRPESFFQFQKILATALNSRGVHVIDLAVDYSLNHSILNVLLKENACII